MLDTSGFGIVQSPGRVIAYALDGGALMPQAMAVGNDRLVFIANGEPPRGQHIPCGRPIGWNIDTAYGFIKEATEIED